MDQKVRAQPCTCTFTTVTPDVLSGSGIRGNANALRGAAAQFDLPGCLVRWRASPTAPALALVISGGQMRSVSLRTGATRTALAHSEQLLSLFACPRDNSLWATTRSQILRLEASPSAASADGHCEFTAEVLAGSA